MTYLLDSHYVLWAIGDSAKLPPDIKEIISNTDNKILVSVVSLWEISLKYSIGKLEIKGLAPQDIPNICLQIGFSMETLSVKDSSTYHQLTATYHKDPFDRMLIWQAIQNNYTLISVDSNVKKYASEGLNVIG